MDPKTQDARNQAFRAAGITAADLPAAEAEFDSAYALGLGGEEALKRTFLALGTPTAQSAVGVRRFVEVQHLHESRKRAALRRWRLAITTVVIGIVAFVVITVFASLATHGATPSETPTPMPTVHAVIDVPANATSVVANP